MGSRTRTSTSTKREALKKNKAYLDKLTTREAQILRMRHGIAEPPSSAVGRPPRGTNAELRKRIEGVEEEILNRIRGDDPEEGAKGKIIKALKKR